MTRILCNSSYETVGNYSQINELIIQTIFDALFFCMHIMGCVYEPIKLILLNEIFI